MSTTTVMGRDPGTRPRTRAWRAARDAARAVRRPTAGLRPAPTFLIVGAQRCGTTSLARDLWRHPGVLGPAFSKGVHYFDVHFDRPEAWYRAHFPTAAARRRAARAAGVPQAAVGEASPYYLFHPAVPGRIARTHPAMRIVAVLRDPVERAWSHYHHEVRRGFETLDFEAAVEAEAERLAGTGAHLCAQPAATSFEHQHHSYVSRGEYAGQVRRYIETFGREQVLVLSAERLFAEPAPSLARVCAFLGLGSPPPGEFPALNATAKAPLEPRVQARLHAHFTPHDEALYELIGEDFGWRR